MARHLFLPKQSIKDIRVLLRLEEEKLRSLEQLFSTGASISPSDPNFLQKVVDTLRVDSDTANSVVLVAQFLLGVVEEGHPATEILDDVRYFVDQYATEDKSTLLTAIDAKRRTLLSLLTPKPERTRAQKIRYLRNIYPTVDSFRTVCELRPVFDKGKGEEEIVGYVPTILLEIKQSGADGECSQMVFHLSADALDDLAKVVKRAEEKLSIIRSRFGEELLGDTSKE